MKGSIVRKIFLSIVGMFVLVMFIQLVFQNFFLEDIYANMKISKVENSFHTFVQEFKAENWSNLELDRKVMDYQNDNNAPIAIFDENNKFSNDFLFKDFNYITIRDNDGNEFRIIIDFLIDEEGKFRNSNNQIKNGDRLNIFGIENKGTTFIEPIEIEKTNNLLINDEGYEFWNELYNENNKVTIKISGTVIARNFIIRDSGVQSYQQEKLLTEIKRYWIEKNEHNEDELFRVGRYDFVEEYSGLFIVVLVDEMKNKDGNKIYVFSLFTLENIHDAFQILNGYYYYIFAFQLMLILVLVYFYSKWITNPLIKLIDSAKSISELDFTKRTNIDTKDELNILSDSLNNIAINLSTAIENLESSNNELAIESIKKTENEDRMRNLLSSLSHEFKTPLAIISGFLEIINDGVYEKEPEYYINVISDEIEKLNGLVLETIELSKLEAGSYKLNLCEFEIKSFVLKMINKFENRFRDKNINCKFDIENKMVIGDKIKIEQVIINLLSNAVRYSPNDENIELTSEVRENKLYIFIENYGVIIDDDELDRVWDRFYRVEKSRNRDLGGSGLGLTIVKNILELHESDYGVENLNNSVKFYFSLKLI